MFTLSLSANAAECINYDQTFAGLVARDMKPFTITADRLPKVVEDVETIMGEKYGPVSRAFIIFGGAITVVGFEVEGCLLPPIYLKNPKADVGA